MTVPLPRLPHTRVDANHNPGGRNIIDVLTDEHDRIATLCRQLAAAVGAAPAEAGAAIVGTAGPAAVGTADARQQRRIADVLVATVSRHLSAEEQYLYPSLRTALDDGVQIAEHEVAADLTLLRALHSLGRARVADPGFPALVSEVVGMLEQHTVETTALFPRLREVASKETLMRLGNRIEIAEEAAPTRPHPGAPHTPPWNKLVEPALGLFDKVLDVATGRPTYPEDLK